jgi:malonyl-CoA/methylmalonyl-CoA synthetase
VEVADGPHAGAHYTWRDLDRGTAMLANLLQSLGLPAGSRVAVQTEKSVEALMLYLAVLRAGHVYLPLNTAYQAAEIEYFIGNAEPAVVVCAEELAWVSKHRLLCRHRPCVHAGRGAHGTLLERAAFQSDQHVPARWRRPTTWPPSSTPAAPPGAARARCSRTATC